MMIPASCPPVARRAPGPLQVRTPLPQSRSFCCHADGPAALKRHACGHWLRQRRRADTTHVRGCEGAKVRRCGVRGCEGARVRHSSQFGRGASRRRRGDRVRDSGRADTIRSHQCAQPCQERRRDSVRDVREQRACAAARDRVLVDDDGDAIDSGRRWMRLQIEQGERT